MTEKININTEKLLEMIESGAKQVEIASYFRCSERTIQRHLANLRASDDDIVKQNIQLAKQKQKFQDLNRIERKSFREQARVENAILEYSYELKKVFESHSLPEFIKGNPVILKNSKATGIIHITDAHFNELVNLSANKYDFKIAAQRLKYLAEKTKIYFKTLKIKNVLIAMTGDLMNSDRRIDELLAEATNRSKATFLAVAILEQFFLDLGQDFNLTIANVVGNESRISKDVSWEENAASDNYDFTIYNILKMIFRNTKVKFLEGNSVEQIIEVSGQNVLLIHGNQIKSNSVEQSIQKIKGKYTSRGIQIDFILFGHLHSTRIGDTYARGASLVGANAYSDNALQLESRASQNIHIFYNNKTRDSIKVDLQDISSVKGYDICKELEAYNAKSLSKANRKVTINRVV